MLAPGAIAPDHSRSRSDSPSSPSDDPNGLTVEGPVPGTSTSVGAFFVSSAALCKFSISPPCPADWPAITIDCPAPFTLALYSGFTSYAVAISLGAKKTFPEVFEVNDARGTTTCGRGLKLLKLRTAATDGAIAAGSESSVAGAKCLLPSTRT